MGGGPDAECGKILLQGLERGQDIVGNSGPATGHLCCPVAVTEATCFFEKYLFKCFLYREKLVHKHTSMFEGFYTGERIWAGVISVDLKHF